MGTLKNITWAEVRKQRRRRELNPVLRIRSASTGVFCFFSYEVKKAKPEGKILRLFPQEKKNLKPAALRHSGLLWLFFFSLKLHKDCRYPPNPQINSSKHPKCHSYYWSYGKIFICFYLEDQISDQRGLEQGCTCIQVWLVPI